MTKQREFELKKIKDEYAIRVLKFDNWADFEFCFTTDRGNLMPFAVKHLEKCLAECNPTPPKTIAPE